MTTASTGRIQTEWSPPVHIMTPRKRSKEMVSQEKVLKKNYVESVETEPQGIITTHSAVRAAKVRLFISVLNFIME